MLRRTAGTCRPFAVDGPNPAPYRITLESPEETASLHTGRGWDCGHREKEAEEQPPARCRFCTKEGCPRPAFVDYKDVSNLKKLITSQGKMFSRKRSGLCATFQRATSDAIKRAVHGPIALRRRMTRSRFRKRHQNPAESRVRSFCSRGTVHGRVVQTA